MAVSDRTIRESMSRKSSDELSQIVQGSPEDYTPTAMRIAEEIIAERGWSPSESIPPSDEGVEDQPAPDAPGDPELRGSGGWLGVLAGLMVVWGGLAIGSFVLVLLFSVATLDFEPITDGFSLATTPEFLMRILLLVGGIALWREHPKGAYLAELAMWAGVVGNFLAAPFSYSLISQFGEPDGFLLFLFVWVLLPLRFLVPLIYLRKSKRVRATFPEYRKSPSGDQNQVTDVQG